MGRLKYLVIAHDGMEVPVVFPSIIPHVELAFGRKVVSAGFCRITAGGWECYGESMGISKKSRGDEDSRLLTALITHMEAVG